MIEPDQTIPISLGHIEIDDRTIHRICRIDPVPNHQSPKRRRSDRTELPAPVVEPRVNLVHGNHSHQRP